MDTLVIPHRGIPDSGRGRRAVTSCFRSMFHGLRHSTDGDPKARPLLHLEVSAIPLIPIRVFLASQVMKDW